MKRTITAVLVLSLVLSLVSVGLVGCAKNESTTNKATEIKTPGESTTITTEKDTKKTGDNSLSPNP